MEVMQEQPVIRRSKDDPVSIGVSVGVVVVLAAAATASADESVYELALKAIFGVAPHKAPLAAHLPPLPPPPPPPPPPLLQHVPIVILTRPGPLGNKDGPDGENDGGILVN